MSETEIKLIKKILYAYESELGRRMGFDPVKQGDDFIAAMTEAYNVVLSHQGAVA